MSLMLAQAAAQSQQSLLREANYYWSQQDYYASIHFYEKSLEDSTDIELAHRLATAYRYTFQYEKASQWYQQLFSLDKGMRHPEALLWKGVMHKHLEEYELAAETLREYMSGQLHPSNFFYRKALVELKGAMLAQQLKDDSTKVSHLDAKINSKVSDFAPFALGDSLLYFSSLEKSDGTETEQLLGHHSQLLYSRYGDLPKEFKVLNHPDYHLANISFNPDASVVYFSRCQQEGLAMRCEVYRSLKQDGLWTNPERLSSEFNAMGANNTHPQWGLWNGVEGLFLSSNRKGAVGGMDLWFVPMEGKATHLGDGINTAGDEVTPFYHSLEQKLYFSSDFHPGIGGFDVFSVQWDSIAWGKVKNEGVPLNSSHNDLYYQARLDDANKGYLSSNRKGALYLTQESCCNDIYAFEKAEECVCKRIDSLATEMQLNLPISLYFHNDEPNPNSRDTSSAVNYATAYEGYYQRKVDYVQQFTAVLSGVIKGQEESKMKRFFEESVKGGYQQLLLFAEQLELAMELEVSLKVSIKGFTSPLNDTEYNKHLAKRRIASVKNFLNEYKNGLLKPYIEQGRLQLVELPFGETMVQTGVSDNPNDRRQSVYSISAARERRIEIQSISIE
jgi:tetratricopeptide (TPR) repeat protein